MKKIHNYSFLSFFILSLSLLRFFTYFLLFLFPSPISKISITFCYSFSTRFGVLIYKIMGIAETTEIQGYLITEACVKPKCKPVITTSCNNPSAKQLLTSLRKMRMAPRLNEIEARH
eukprot:TRINITY_DN14168_c0_g1_i1.p1 TRINITY_DN14168_c0_g1~~TRINITY_DN14168_c0_g1_i1.p1  ORF type:complete len:117 (-),score=1.28 TRINITY_DN14168_c0_g1_i1:340-690(-)